MNNLKKYITLILILITHGLAAQSLDNEKEMSQIIPGPDGAVISLLNLYEKGESNALEPGSKIVIQKGQDGQKFKKVAEISFPGKARDLKKQLGNQYESVKEFMGVNNENSLFQKVITSNFDSLGFAVWDKKLAQTFMMIFIDDKHKQNTSAVYKLQRYNKDKKLLKEITLNTNGRSPDYSVKPYIISKSVSDSSAIARWYFDTDENFETPLIKSNIYKNDGNRFSLFESSQIAPLDESDSLMVTLVDSLVPGGIYQYFIQIEDWAGNKGVPSDTLYALAFDPLKIKPIYGFKGSQDSTESNKINLSWEKLPNQAIYSGIELSKSRNADSDFVVLDTIPAKTTQYIDQQNIKGSIYYYRIKPIYFDPEIIEAKYSETSVSIQYTGDELPPGKPQGLKIKTDEEGIHLSWWRPEEADIFSYHILRGYSADNMEAAYVNIKDTQFTDTLIAPGYNGPLLYAVQAVSFSQKESEPSDIVSVNIKQPTYVMPPGGISIRMVDEGVSLLWNDVRKSDDNIVGYIVFRKEGDEKFKAVNDELLKLSYYIDDNYDMEAQYEYAVVSVDMWGNFSQLSSSAHLDLKKEIKLTPPLEIHLRNLQSGIEISWPISLSEKPGNYIIYRKADRKGNFTRLAEAAINEKYIDNNVRPNTIYEYRVTHQYGDRESTPGFEKELRRKQ